MAPRAKKQEKQAAMIFGNVLDEIEGLAEFLQPAPKELGRRRAAAAKDDQALFVSGIDRQLEWITGCDAGKNPIDGKHPGDMIKYSEVVSTLVGDITQDVPKDLGQTKARGAREKWYRIHLDKHNRSFVFNLYLGNLLVFDQPFLIIGGWDGLINALEKIKKAALEGHLNARLDEVRKASTARRAANAKAKAEKASDTPPSAADGSAG